VCADPVLVPADAMLGPDGGGLDIVVRTVTPWLLELRAAADGHMVADTLTSAVGTLAPS
jgi:hypothetical protein